MSALGLVIGRLGTVKPSKMYPEQNKTSFYFGTRLATRGPDQMQLPASGVVLLFVWFGGGRLHLTCFSRRRNLHILLVFIDIVL